MGKKYEDKNEQQVCVTGRDLQAHGKSMIHASLILATSNMVQPLVAGKSPKEAVDTFAQMYSHMQDWYKATPMKKEIESLLDVVLESKAIDQWDAELKK
ncbi:MAG: hypothetical protein SVY53_14160 [Chloroflexota bacterium]|nr:hypothetical protein [Chloroflexota bacterium]